MDHHGDHSAHGAHEGHDMHATQDPHADHDMHAGHNVQNVVEAVTQAVTDFVTHGHLHNEAKSEDHSGHSSVLGHGMSMTFHGGFNETVLFNWWSFSSAGGLFGSIVVIFIMAVLYEGLKYYREYLFWRTYNNLQYRAVQPPEEKATPADQARVVHMVGEVFRKQPPTMCSRTHAWQTTLHAVQVTVSYLLMLIFMTYNTWLCVAVVAGAATGNFLFGWKKSVIVDVTEHCH